MRPSTDEHDYQVRLRSAIKFLSKVRVHHGEIIRAPFKFDHGFNWHTHDQVRLHTRESGQCCAFTFRAFDGTCGQRPVTFGFVFGFF